jgi:hypothetical protein
MRNVSDKGCRENQKNILCSATFIPENRAVYEKKKKKMAKAHRPQIKIQQDSCSLHAG